MWNSLIRNLRGTVRLRITGAAPETLLNALAEAGIAFWELEREDALHYSCTVWRHGRRAVEPLAARCLCVVETLQERGAPVLWRRLRRRPVLLLALAAAIAACFLSQRYILFITVEGEKSVREEEILHALEELGIHCGTPTGALDSELTKHRMLNAVPELSWIGTNRSGFCLRAEVTERSEAELEAQPYAAAHIVARRSGLLTDVSVFQGMRLCQEGDAVCAGQLLVSAFEDHGLFLRAVCAEAEIYAQTWYSGTVVMPKISQQKCYTGEVFRELWLLVGRKRIKICGSSSISLTECDKMVEVKRIQLPQGYTLPLALEICTYRRYETQPVELSAQTARAQLLSAWLLQCRRQMNAGCVLETASSLLHTDALYVLNAESTCHEMIARLVPVQDAYGGEKNE